MAGIPTEHCYACSTWAWLTICAISLLTARFNWVKCGEIGAHRHWIWFLFAFPYYFYFPINYFSCTLPGVVWGKKSLFYNLILSPRCDVCSFWFECITVILTINNAKREKININTFTFDIRVSGIFISFCTKAWRTLKKISKETDRVGCSKFSK